MMVLAQATTAGPRLSVSGDVTGLVAGRPGRLLLTVRNDGEATVVVHRLATSVRSVVPGWQLAYLAA